MAGNDDDDSFPTDKDMLILIAVFLLLAVGLALAGV